MRISEKEKQKIEDNNISMPVEIMDLLFKSKERNPEDYHIDKMLFQYYIYWKQSLDVLSDKEIMEYSERYNTHASREYTREYGISRQYFFMRRKWLLRSFTQYVKEFGYNLILGEGL